MTNFTRAWGASYEALPPDSGEDASIGASRIRQLKLDVRERMAVDHAWNDNLSVSSEDGEHTKVTLEQRSAPSAVADRIILYGKDYNNGSDTKCELWFREEGGIEHRITERGFMALLRSANSWSKNQFTSESVLTDAATIAVDSTLSNTYTVTLGGDRILGLPTGGAAGKVISIRIRQDGIGNRALDLATNFLGNPTDDLVLSTGASKYDLLTLYCHDSGTWLVVSLKKDIANAL